MAKLTANVAVRHPDTGAVEVLLEGSDLPSWAAGLVGDHALDGRADSGKDDGGGIPPKGGPGSGKDAWVAYAAEHDVEVPADATREDIVAALDAADVPTE